ncbi:MAG: tetratricopeptide repeat protein [Rhodothermales bacterium]
MIVSLLAASALFAQSADQIANAGASVERVDVAYEELMAERNREAVEHILASPLDDEGDPAALINLGTAYARLGETEKALHCFETAINSDTRYMLELSDGTWMDSRRAARKAAQVLMNGETLALR